jgi:uncharacterized membrane protein YgaE (UPF0421/DUF939 family)
MSAQANRPSIAKLSARTRFPLVARSRYLSGMSRVRAAFWPVTTAAIAGAVAFLIGRHVLGHEAPFFAAIAAWACLGFTFNRTVRHILEVGAGVIAGVTAGDLVVNVIGTGWWQLLSVLMVTALLARFVDRGAVLAAQAGTQAIVIVGMPSLTGGPFGRAADTIVGVAIALIVALLTPHDPRRSIRLMGATATRALAETIAMTADGIRRGDPERIDAALLRGRAAEPALLEWNERSQAASELARVSVNRLHLDELVRLENQSVLVERAMRSVRVIARRAPAAVKRASDVDRARMADLLDRFSTGISLWRDSLISRQSSHPAKEVMTSLAADLDVSGFDDIGMSALTMVLRAPVVDMLEAWGSTPAQARVSLPEI